MHLAICIVSFQNTVRIPPYIFCVEILRYDDVSYESSHIRIQYVFYNYLLKKSRNIYFKKHDTKLILNRFDGDIQTI